MTQNGTNIVVSSGNYPISNGHYEYSHIPGIIVVSSHDQYGNIGTGNHSYKEYVDLVAPGAKVYLPTANTLFTCKMRYATGTSASAPLVAGTIGLMLSANPCLSAYEVENILKETALPVTNPSFAPTGYGAGRLNTFGAVEMSYETNTTTNINLNTTWSGNKYINGDIIIQSGATLTITGKVYMGCWNKIWVNKNAKLIIDGGHITTNKTISKWNGIYIFGNPERNTHENPEHGYLEMKNNAIIENASYAVNNFFDTDYDGGGIIKISNSTFKNCIRAVNLHYYPNSYWLYTWGIASNCSITNTEFLYDNENANKHPSIIDDAPRNIYPILSWGTLNGIVIKDCTFNMNIPISEKFTNTQRGIAIYMASSGAHIEGNKIEGFLKGIFLDNDMNVKRQVKIIENEITDNYWGIDGLGDINTLIINNDIINTSSWNIPGAAHDYNINTKKRAIYLNGNGLTKIIGNQIQYPFHSTIHNRERTYGIVANYTQSEYKTFIRENKFIDNYTHIHAQNNNAGLAAYCNEFDGQYRTAIAFIPSFTYHQLASHGTNCYSLDQYSRASNTFINQRAFTFQLLYDNSFLGSTPIPSQFNYYTSDNALERITRVLDPSPGSVVVQYSNCLPISSEETHSFCDEIFIPITLIDIIQLNNLKTEFKLLSNNQLRYSSKAMYLYGEILRGYVDVYRFDSDSLISFLKEDNTIMSDILLIPLFIENKHYNLAINKLNNLNINSDQKDALINYYETIIDLMQNDNWKILNLSASQIQEMQSIVSNDSLIAYPYALSLLHRAGIEDYSDKFPIYTGDIDTSQIQNKPKTSQNLDLDESFSLYPNPTNDRFTIEYLGNSNDFKPYKLTIFSTIGTEIYSSIVSNKIVSLSKHSLNMSPGIYFIVIHYPNQEANYKKIIINQ